MVTDYFAEFYVSDDELKEKIYQILKSLNIFAPEEFGSELMEYADPQLPSEVILQNLTNPFLKVIDAAKRYKKAKVLEDR